MEYCTILLIEHLSIAYISDIEGRDLHLTLFFLIRLSFLANAIYWFNLNIIDSFVVLKSKVGNKNFFPISFKLNALLKEGYDSTVAIVIQTCITLFPQR